MNMVTKATDDLPAEVQAPTLMDIIARAAQDPNTDVGKLERLMDMARQVKADDAKTAYYAAMAEMQDKLPMIEERGEIKIGNNPSQKYALWEDINKIIKPIMKDHGFAITFRTGIADGKITVTGVLSHKQGHSEETTIHLPADISGSKNPVQAVGSSTSYGKRYTASALLNLTYGGQDDDGKVGGKVKAPTRAEKGERLDKARAWAKEAIREINGLEEEYKDAWSQKNAAALVELYTIDNDTHAQILKALQG